MAKWYLRHRGQVVGPFTAEQIRDMRAQGTVASYHEVSADKRVWKLIDDVRELSDKAPPPPPPQPRQQPEDEDEPAGGTSRPYVFVVAGVLGLALLGGIALAVLLLRIPTKATPTAPEQAEKQPPPPNRVAEGPIVLTDQNLADHERVFRDSVGLVVSGLEVKFPDGRLWEVPAYSLEPRGDRLVIRFGNAMDLLPAKSPFPPGFDIQDFGTGSGFAVNPHGHFVTNRHVVEELRNFDRSEDRRKLERQFGATIDARVWVFFGREQKHVAKIHYVCDEYDMAVLKLEREPKHYFALSSVPPTSISYLKNLSSLGFPGVDRANLTDKDRADAILRKAIDRGPIQSLFPERTFEFSSRSGEITNKAFQNRMRAGQREAWVLQHSAQIFGGNSGGPLVSKDGTVVGINTWSKDQIGFNYALTLPQLRKELDVKVPGAVWRELRP